MMATESILQATLFAVRAHGDQKRKYTGEPYVIHCIEVARIIEGLYYPYEVSVVQAALLHDVIEDTHYGYNDIKSAFGEQVANLVLECSDKSRPEDGNRAVRKAIDREWYGQASAEGQTIKLADLIDNSLTITFFDPDFAKVYMREKKALLKVLTKGNKVLHRRATQLVHNWERQCSQV